MEWAQPGVIAEDVSQAAARNGSRVDIAIEELPDPAQKKQSCKISGGALDKSENSANAIVQAVGDEQLQDRWPRTNTGWSTLR